MIPLSVWQKAPMLLATLLLLNGCVKNNFEGRTDRISRGEYFDYSTVQSVSVEIDYCLSDYIVLFHIYDQNPITENSDGSLSLKNISPIYTAATDKNGKYNVTSLSVPATMKEAWLVSFYPGVISPVKVEIADKKIVHNQKTFIDQFSTNTAKIGSRASYTYPQDMMPLGGWDALGKPDYMLSALALPAATTLYRIKDTYRKSGDYTLVKNHPEFFDGTMSSDVNVTKPTKLKLVFLDSGAGWDNTVGYYTYPTDKVPTSASEIQKIIAYPNSSPIYYNGKHKGSLLCGNQVELKYWDGEKFQDEFPAGVSIGWFLQGMGFKDGNVVEGRGTRYSTMSLNSDNKQRTVSLRDPDSNQIVSIGFEDNIDFDYCDATFYLDIEKSDAIDPSLPEIPGSGTGPDENQNKTIYYGTITYEDLWPAQGDYDMNDLIIDYRSTVYKSIIGNRVVKVVDEFTPRHAGGSFLNGFGYSFSKLANGSVRKVTIEGVAGATKYNGSNNMEAGQSHPTIILFDNIYNCINQKFTVTSELNDVEAIMVTPPHNPFIFINQDRGREVHLVNFPPTDKANKQQLGSAGDVSDPTQELYYVSKDNMPFAIHLSRVEDFPVPSESVRIDVSYKYFAAWAKSFGKEHPDWYKK